MRKVFKFNIVAMLILGIVVSQLIGLGAVQEDAGIAQQSKAPVIVLFSSTATESDRVGAVSSVGGEVTRRYNIINGVAALVPTSRIQELRDRPRVVSVDKDIEVRATDASADRQISANQVWSLGYTGSGVRLAILDTGIATAHVEFTNRIVACKSEITEVTGCQDDNGHGTHVAGIAGAQGVNSDAKGVAPSVLLMSDKVLKANGTGTLSQVIAGIDWAVANNARIISMSLSTPPVDGGGTQANCDSAIPTLTESINKAVAAGITVVAAAGNSGTGGLGAPGCISSVLAVGAVDGTDRLAEFSGAGAAMKDHGVVAPGVDIFSTWLNGDYNILSGTSMSTPMVSGTIALMLSKNPDLSPSSIRNILFNTADCVQSSSPCPNNNIGYGRINASRAVNGITATPIDFSISINPTNGSVIQGGSTAATVSIALVSGSSQQVSLSYSVTPTPSKGIISTTFSPPTGNPPFTSSMNVASSADTAPGTYTIKVTGSGGGVTRSADFALTVKTEPISAPPLSISVTTDRDRYRRGSDVKITTKVISSGTAVRGAEVRLTITDPNNQVVWSQSGTTDSGGTAQSIYVIPINTASGRYTISAVASASGYTSGSGSTTFKAR